MTHSDQDSPEEEDEAPPLGSWNILYGVLVAALFLQILVYLWLTEWAS